MSTIRPRPKPNKVGKMEDGFMYHVFQNCMIMSPIFQMEMKHTEVTVFTPIELFH